MRHLFVKFFSYGHVPEWLDTNNDKIVIVKHSDFIPKEYLPTFNSAAIEVNLFRIKGLSERFIYFNDDVYLCAPVVPEDFFVENKVKYNYSEGLLCFDESLDLVFRSILLNVARIVNKNFDKWDTMKKRPRTFFSFTNGGGTRNSLRYINFNKYLGPVPAHISMPFLKSTFRDVWRAEHLELDNASRLKFRTASTISPYLVEAWQAFSGKTVPYRQGRFGKLFVEDKVTTEMMDSIEKGLYKVICLNGHFDERSVDDLKKAFLKAVPERSSFEK
jgi:hypothetical protein